MAEEEFALEMPDGFKIYGVINKNSKKPNTKAILHIHGLKGSSGSYAAVRLAQAFPKYGYDVIRIDLYSSGEKARNLFDCTIQQHAIDIDFVAAYFKKKYKKLFATGQSYGGPSLMMAKINQFTAVSLWDPTYLPEKVSAIKNLTKVGKYYIALRGVPLVLSKAFIDEAKSFDRKKAIALSKKCKIPLQVIYARHWVQEGESFHTHAKGPTDEQFVKQTQHNFDEEGAIAPLLRHTRQWFDQF